MISSVLFSEKLLLLLFLLPNLIYPSKRKRTIWFSDILIKKDYYNYSKEVGKFLLLLLADDDVAGLQKWLSKKAWLSD